jgi:uncharacterized integral membrane protein (TIGR00698 family)
MALGIGAYAAAKGLTAWGAEGHYPPVSPILCAILLGLTWRNLFGVDQRWLPGLQWVGGALLRGGIALVGLRLTLTGVGSAVTLALPVVIGCVTVAVVTSIAVGRLLGLSRSLRLLIAVGSGICGCTAIMAVTPLVRARPMETTVALTCVALLGSAGMLCYPWLAHALFPTDARLAGVLLGTSIHDTSQVVGASLIYTQQFGAADAAPFAALTKLIRNSLLLVLVPTLALLGAAPALLGASATVRKSKRSIGFAQVLPPFLLCFLALAVVRTAGDALLGDSASASSWSSALAIALSASDFILICGMTAVGLSVSLRDLRDVGLRAFGTALTVSVAVATCSAVLTIFVQRFFLAH